MPPGDARRRAEFLALWHARDAAANGRFVAGVTSTGIYCLPACPARRPKDEHVRFFADGSGAEAAGFRACLRCRPELFRAGVDPEVELASALALTVRARVGDFPSVRALRAEAGVGGSKLRELFRRQFHTTPRDFLHAERTAASAAALLAGRRPLDAALDHGFESSSVFHAAFAARLRMTPGAYAKLGASNEFELSLPPNASVADAFAVLRRDGDVGGRTERVEGARAWKAVLLGGRPAVLELEVRERRVRVRVRGLARPGRARLAAAHALVVRLLGLALDPAPFERWVARTPGLAALVRGRTGLCIPLTADAFEGLVWAIVGQQVNIAFAATCRARLIELAGTEIGDLRAHPTPDAVASLELGDLVARQFSRRKAEYTLDSARAVASGALDLAALARGPVGRSQPALLALRGFGPWSANYVLMRAFGLADCVPAGDVALAEGLMRFFELSERPDARATVRWMERFAPHRSLATFHLWRWRSTSPACAVRAREPDVA
ncbi:MAG: Ada metal-binding domain-containing protein [Planctomycetota bacterium]